MPLGRATLNSQQVAVKDISCKNIPNSPSTRHSQAQDKRTMTSSLPTGLQLPQLDGEEPGRHGDPAGGRETHPWAPEN